MSVRQAVRLRLERRRLQIRAVRKRRELRSVRNRTKHIGPGDVLAFLTIRNEVARLPYFLKYYRSLGVAHFLFVDNGSTDGGLELLKDAPDVSVWSTHASYRNSRFGTDWLNWLRMRYAHGHWALTLDPDEFLVYPFCDTRPIPALCDWLDRSGIRSFGSLLLDMYPKTSPSETVYIPGENPIEKAPFFDTGNYIQSRNPRYENLWIQGGPRARVYFADKPEDAPSLNKIPLVRWDRKFVYVSSTHMILPRGLNHVYDTHGGEKASGCLLHVKFFQSLEEKAEEERRRGEHFAGGREYAAYERGPSHSLWTEWSERYINWRQLELLGLMSKGNWA